MVIRSHKTKKEKQKNGQKKQGKKRKTKIYKTLYRKLKIGQHKHHYNPEMNAGAPEGIEVLVSSPHVAPVVLLVNEANII